MIAFIRSGGKDFGLKTSSPGGLPWHDALVTRRENDGKRFRLIYQSDTIILLAGHALDQWQLRSLLEVARPTEQRR